MMLIILETSEVYNVFIKFPSKIILKVQLWLLNGYIPLSENSVFTFLKPRYFIATNNK